MGLNGYSPPLSGLEVWFFVESRFFNMIAKTKMTKQGGTWCFTIPVPAGSSGPLGSSSLLFFTPAYSDLLQSLRLVSQGSSQLLAVTRNMLLKTQVSSLVY